MLVECDASMQYVASEHDRNSAVVGWSYMYDGTEMLLILVRSLCTSYATGMVQSVVPIGP